MRRALALAAAAVACTVAPAHAASPTYLGGCGYDTGSLEVVVAGQHAGTRTRYRGVLYGAMALFDEASPGTPVSGTVRCILKVDGVVVRATTPVHGTGFVATAEPLDITLADPWNVELCEEVAYDGGPTDTVCGASTQMLFPPQELWDLADAVTQGTVTPLVAPLACPVTGDSAVNRELLGAWFGQSGYVYGFPC
jgi:hypothetical protein